MIKSNPIRVKEIKLIHVARRELNMVDDTYRALLMELTAGKKNSSANLNADERRQVLEI